MQSLATTVPEMGRLAIRLVAESLNAWHFVGAWIYPYVCMVVWPLWLMVWSVCWMPVEPADREPHPHSD